MSWSCPFHSFQLPLHVPVIFSVCPLHFPCMSRSFGASHFPTSPVVPIGFIALCFPVIPPALPSFSLLSLSCPFQFPFVSLSFPVAFLTCGLPISSPHFLALPCISPLLLQKHRVFPDFSWHFLAFPLAQYFPQKSTVFPAFSQRGHPQTQSFFRKSKQETQTSKKPAGGIEPGTPVLRHRLPFSGTSSNHVGNPPTPLPGPHIYKMWGGGGGG